MPSSSGRMNFRCSLLRHSARTRAMVCAIEITGEFFARGTTKTSGEIVPDFKVVLSQVLIDRQAVRVLRDRLLEWHTNPASFEIELGTSQEGDQHLSLALAEDPRLLYEVHKPACIITYGSPSAMQGRWSFLVDQSCVQTCAEELRALLSAE